VDGEIKMRIVCTTDTHWNHAQMVEYCGRPTDFEERVYNGLLSFCQSGDVLIHFGDICIGNDEDVHRKYIQTLPYRHRWLVRGNHDKKSDSWYMDHGWTWVGSLMRSKYFGQRVMLSHKPQPWHSEEEWDLNIHGHFHNAFGPEPEAHPEVTKYFIRDEAQLVDRVIQGQSRHVLLALEYTGYQPVLLRTLVERGVASRQLWGENKLVEVIS